MAISIDDPLTLREWVGDGIDSCGRCGMVTEVLKCTKVNKLMSQRQGWSVFYFPSHQTRQFSMLRQVRSFFVGQIWILPSFVAIARVPRNVFCTNECSALQFQSPSFWGWLRSGHSSRFHIIFSIYQELVASTASTEYFKRSYFS